MGDPRIFKYDIEPDDIKEPVIVTSEGETVEIDDDEMNLLKLGPKFCLFVNLDDETFESDLEEMIMKIKWDMMADDDREKPGLEDIALRVLLGDDLCTEIDDEREEEMELREAVSRTPFNQAEMTLNMARRRVTDLKGNSRVHFPRKPRPLDEEAALETLRVEMRSLFRTYVSKNCKEGGVQASNLTKSQAKGLKSLKKRVSGGELVIIPTDKSGNLAIIIRLTNNKAYYEAGMNEAHRQG